MLLLILGVTLCVTSAYSYIPSSNVCYQHANPASACVYGNLTAAAVGYVFKPKDCNSMINIKALEHAPFIYINSTNTTARFTVVMVDSGPMGRGPDYLQWMITNISINTPNYQSIPPNNILAGYQPPMLMHGQSKTLIQILVFQHQNVLRVPFGELWVTRRRNFSLSTLFSNTAPNLKLCGPVAGTQYWVSDTNTYLPSAPPAPLPAGPPYQPVYVPVVPVQPGYVPVGSAPIAPHPGQAGVIPPPPHSSPPHSTGHKRSLGTVTQPMQLLFVPLVVCTVMFL